MSLTCRVRITLDSVSGHRARAVEKALEPDNVDFPEKLSLHVENVNGKLVFDFDNHGDLGKLIGTIDEMLEHIHVALRVTE